MPYSDFTLDQVQKEFELEVIENKDIFSQIKEVEISPLLIESLDFNIPLALAINTEKARSELIISNVLIEVIKLLNKEVSLFSGINLDVDKQKGNPKQSSDNFKKNR
ncbi:hypothetical protein QUF74_04415 [Candidatus Halobeggiatoa sp. HSG11]|nr:hypothetical protein [Candidatus Halobeggiatoa sp. HSG11]